MEEASRLCDRVAVIDRGQRLALGTPAQLIASLGAEHVVEFETTGDNDNGSGGVEGSLFEDLPGVESVARIDGAWRLTVREIAPLLAPLLARLSDRGLEASRLATHHATLEDVFLALAGHGLTEEESES
jgi:ABC-2 type transport system ATP-binding protein